MLNLPAAPAGSAIDHDPAAAAGHPTPATAALELQAHIRELLESNIMLEPVEESEGTGVFEAVEERPAPNASATSTNTNRPAPERAQESTVEVVDEGWANRASGQPTRPGRR